MKIYSIRFYIFRVLEKKIMKNHWLDLFQLIRNISNKQCLWHLKLVDHYKDKYKY